MPTRHVMLIDARRCIDCKACLLACKTAHQLPTGHWRNWIHEASPAAAATPLFQPGACQHCAQAPCVAACPSGATFRDADSGEVCIDPQTCIGCGACVSACPYSARSLRSDLRVADKCDFCASRRKQGLLPACVDTCPTGVRIFGDANDPQSPVAAALASGTWVALEPANSPTQPNLLYAETTKPDHWLRPSQEIPVMGALSTVFVPLVRAAVGLSALGVAATLVRQVFLPDPPEKHILPENSTSSTDKNPGGPHA